jgi:hypothetical protein
MMLGEICIRMSKTIRKEKIRIEGPRSRQLNRRDRHLEKQELKQIVDKINRK